MNGHRSANTHTYVASIGFRLKKRVESVAAFFPEDLGFLFKNVNQVTQSIKSCISTYLHIGLLNKRRRVLG